LAKTVRRIFTLADELRRFCGELETLLADICFSGLRNVSPGVLEKCSFLEAAAKELGMNTGARLLGAFAAALSEYRSGRGGGSVPAALLCRLDFYEKTVAGNLE
jgi:hypothetical protein